ncbi:MAG: hypothetical protein AAF916_00960 [Planctomycetota bacterium]
MITRLVILPLRIDGGLPMETEAPIRLDEPSLAALVERLVRSASAALASDRRYVLGIAGVAGSGKSTLAQRLVDSANVDRDAEEFAVFAPMDGFHFSNAELESEGWIHRKGAPFTYDAVGFLEMLASYRETKNTGDVPIYCREVHEPVLGDRKVTAETALIVTEGQYLLLNEEPWFGLIDILDQTWWLDTPRETAKRWTIERHVTVGRTREEAEQKFAQNDGPNSRLVYERRRKPDQVVCW